MNKLVVFLLFLFVFSFGSFFYLTQSRFQIEDRLDGYSFKLTEKEILEKYVDEYGLFNADLNYGKYGVFNSLFERVKIVISKDLYETERIQYPNGDILFSGKEERKGNDIIIYLGVDVKYFTRKQLQTFINQAVINLLYKSSFPEKYKEKDLWNSKSRPLSTNLNTEFIIVNEN